MSLMVYFVVCAWLVVIDMRGFTGNKRWPREDKPPAKRPGTSF